MNRYVASILMLLSFAILPFQSAWAQAVDNPRVITVSVDGSGYDYTNLADALSSDPDPGSVVLVYPGVYEGADNYNLVWPSGVALRGIDRATTIIRGSEGELDTHPLIDLTSATDVVISNITLDGSQVATEDTTPAAGATIVCGADNIVLDNVTYINGGGYYSRFSLSSVESLFGCSSSTGTIVVKNSDIAPIGNFGGHWEIRGSRLHAVSTDQPGDDEVVIALASISQSLSTVTIVDSILETVAKANHGLVANYALYIEGAATRIEIVGSTITARTEEDAPGYDTAAVVIADGTDLDQPVIIEGSLIKYVSVTGASSGEFSGVYGVASESSPSRATLHIQGSTIQGIGSGGTRADIDIDEASPMFVSSTAYSTVAGDEIDYISATDERQAYFSADLTIPISAPTAASPADGQIWIDDSTNKFCYRSNGTTRCVLGTTP